MAYGDQTITFTNYSSEPFVLGGFGTYPDQTNCSITQAPAQTLEAGSGQQVLMSTMTGILATPWKVWCYWACPTTFIGEPDRVIPPLYFGVLIGFGAKNPTGLGELTPTWATYCGTTPPSGAAGTYAHNDFTEQTSAQPYTFPFPQYAPFGIVCTPNLGDPATLSILIQDQNGGPVISPGIGPVDPNWRFPD